MFLIEITHFANLYTFLQNRYLATAASNRELKIWDVRKLEGPVQEYKLISAANNINFSQKNMLALGMGNVVEVYRFVLIFMN